MLRWWMVVIFLGLTLEFWLDVGAGSSIFGWR
jgi:hypothetical protein